MLALLRWLSLRHWLSHPVRMALTVLGVALGVSVTLSVRLIGDEILTSHQRTLERIAGKAQLTVKQGVAGMRRDVTDRVLAVDGVAHAAPMLEKVLLEPEHGPVLLLGIDLLGDRELQSLEAEEGDEEVLDDPIAFLNSTEATVVPRSFATARGLRKGDAFELITSLGRKRFFIAGVLQDRGAVRSFGGDVVVMFLDAAQVALDLDQDISRVDLSAAPGVDVKELKARLEAALGDGFDVEYPEARGARLEQMLQGMTQALGLMVALAVWVGMLLAYNAVEISVRQRQRQIAILRALGAGRGAVVAQVLLEAALLGLLATAVGTALGLGMARSGLQQTADTVSTIYQVVKVEEVQLSLRALLPALFVGLVIPVLAALHPARWVAAQPPHLGLTRPVEEEMSLRGESRALLAGAAIMAAGIAVFLLPQASHDVWVGQSAFGIVLFGALFLSPAAVAAGARLVHWSAGDRLSAEAVVATDHVVRDRRRAALNVASLVAGVATVVTVATYIHSLKVTYDAWIEAAAPADLFITAGASFGISKNLPMDPSVGDQLATLPEVERMLRGRFLDVDHLGHPIKVLGIEMNDYLALAKPILIEGHHREPGTFPVATHVWISENVARRGDYHVGSEIELPTAGGPRRFTVDVIILDFTSDQGLVVMDRATFIDAFKDDRVDTFDLFLKPGFDVGAVQDEVRRRWGADFDLFVLTSAEFKGEAIKLIDQIFQLLALIQLVTLVIAVLGVTTTLVASVLDRGQEVGLMRAVGSTPGQIVRIVLTEAAFIGGFASFLGAALGTLTGYLFLKTVVVASVGWLVPWRFPLAAVPTTCIAVTVASILSGLYPALWSARQPMLEAMNEE